LVGIRRKVTRLHAKFYIRIFQILGLCGFGFLVSCIKNNDGPVPMYGAIPMYGTPSIKFYGTIKSEDSLKNIPGLTVRLVINDGLDSLKTITNDQGQYELYEYSYEGDVLKLKVLDTDSTANLGNFKNNTLDIEVSGRDVNNMERQVDVLMNKK
jgi:hypothetical protein